jgi:hypothetical protein
MSKCNNCSAAVDSAWSFCDSCGMFVGRNNSQKVECETHPKNSTIGFCVICSKPMCADCVVKVGNKLLCTNPEHQDMLQNWQVICCPETEYEADAVVCNLVTGGIEAKTFSLHDHIAAREMNESRVIVFVKKSEIEKSKTLLLDLNLIYNA